MSVLSITLTTWPLPSHWLAWQSPDVLGTTVPAGRLTPPETQAESVVAHCPATQAWPAAHTLAQAPQWLTSVKRLISHPFPALPSQLPKPALQA
jgi:hypothetical protein